MNNKHKENIAPYNNNGDQHGMWEIYYYDGTLSYKGNYINGEEVGYCEWGHGPKRFYLI